MVRNISYLFILSILLFSFNAYAKGIYLKPAKFIAEVFDNDPPKAKKIWVKKELKAGIKNILGHDLAVIRIRYWDDGSKTAWILEEIGRDKLITAGFVVKEKKIAQVNILIFRESRGWEIKYPFFTDQFKQATLVDNNKLDRKIDGISGATLSVHALTRLAQLALYLDSQVNKK